MKRDSFCRSNLAVCLSAACFALCCNGCNGDKIKKLFAWAKQKGTFVHDCLEYRDYGMYTTCSIPEQTALVCVPMDITLVPPLASDEISINTQLTQILLSANESHPLWPYIDALPKTCQNLVCQKPDISVLTRSGLHKIEKLQSRFASVPHEQKVAVSVVQSRSWPHGMVPILDLFNHDEFKSKIPFKDVKHKNNKTYTCLISSNHTYSKGDEVYNSYGESSHFHWYKHYGFVPHYDTHSCEDMLLLRHGAEEDRVKCISEATSTVEHMIREYVDALKVGDEAMMKGASLWLSNQVPDTVAFSNIPEWIARKVPPDVWEDVVSLHMRSRLSLNF